MPKVEQILTLNNLFDFCKKNKLFNFSSKETGRDIVVQDFEKINYDQAEEENGFLPVKLMACHEGLNRNNSFISHETMVNALPSFEHRPILGNIIQLDDGSYDFHSHDMDIDENGNIVYIEKPVGVIVGNDAKIEHDDEYDKDYVAVNGLVFTDYGNKAASIIKSKEKLNVSVELCINSMEFNAKKNYLEITDFYFNGVTILGSETDGTTIECGMIGSNLQIQYFRQDKKSYETKMLETLDELNKTLSNFNIKQYEEGGKNEVKFDELLKKYNKTVEEITFEYANLSDAELEAKFEEAFKEASQEGDNSDEDKENSDNNSDSNSDNDNSSDEQTNSEDEKDSEADNTDDEPVSETEKCKKKKCSIEINGEKREFELSLNDKIYAISNLINNTYSEADNDYYGVQAYDNYVVMIGYWNNRAYKQNYSIDENDSITLTGDRVEVFANWLTEDEEKSLKDMRSHYDEMSASLKAYQNAEIQEQKIAIIESDEAYAQYEDNEIFSALIAKMDNYSLDEFKIQVELAFSQSVKASGKFSMTEKKPHSSKVTVGDVSNTEGYKPYGGIFEENGITR